MNKLLRAIKMIPNRMYCSLLAFLLILSSMGFGLEDIVKRIKWSIVSETYETLTGLCPNLSSMLSKYKWFFVILIFVNIICLFIKNIIKRKIQLIAHFSMGDDYGEIDESVKKEYHTKIVLINQVNDIEDGKPAIKAIVDIDNAAKEATRVSNRKAIGYYGIAHMPLIFRLGFMMNDQSEIHAFHRSRGNGEKYKELKHEIRSSLYIKEDEKNETKSSDELVVAISTSFLIKKNEVENSFGNDKHEVFFELNNLGVDVLVSYDDVERLSSEIWSKIRTLTKKYGIKKLHIVMSSSSVFTLFVGKGCSRQIDPITIVYHYQNGYYPWGICMNNTPEEALIQNGIHS